MNRKFEQDLFEMEIFCNTIYVFVVPFDQFNAFMLNKSRDKDVLYLLCQIFEW